MVVNICMLLWPWISVCKTGRGYPYAIDSRWISVCRAGH